MTDFRSRLNAGLLGLLLALAFCQSADAIVFPHTYKVGPKPACDFATIQEAIDAASSTAGDTIALDPALSYPGQHLDNKGKSLTFTAGAVCTLGGAPSADTAGTQATVSGDLNASAPVFKITGAGNVTLVDLKITGNKSSGNGGGISYQGSGTLKLTNVAVLSNTANYGGGILFDGSGSLDAELILDTNTQVIGNTAMVSGGGIRVQGNGKLFASEAGNWIANNHAPNGYGGGIELYGGTATLNSPGVAGNPLIYLNDAMYGGGIAIEAIAASDYYYDSTLNVGAVDPKFPLRIEGNNATQLGGGIYMIPDNSTTSGAAHATVYANRYRINSNTAPEGSAIFGDCVDDLIFSCEIGSGVYLNNIACAGVDCNTIDGNENEDSEHNPTGGSTIRLKNGFVFAHGLHMRKNLGGHVLCSTDTGEFYLANSLLAENQVTQELIKADSIYLSQSTLANDSIASDYTINHTSGDGLTMYNLVLGEAGTAALEGSLDNASIHNVVALDAGGLPNAADIIETDPFFFDVAHGDYRLRLQTGGQPNVSSALDFSATSANDDSVDIDSRLRNVDLQYVGDRFGTIDLGAYEMQPIADRVFADGIGDPILLVY